MVGENEYEFLETPSFGLHSFTVTWWLFVEQTRVHVLIYQVHLDRAIQRFSLLAAVLLSVNENGNTQH